MDETVLIGKLHMYAHYGASIIGYMQQRGRTNPSGIRRVLSPLSTF